MSAIKTIGPRLPDAGILSSLGEAGLRAFESAWGHRVAFHRSISNPPTRTFACKPFRHDLGNRLKIHGQSPICQGGFMPRNHAIGIAHRASQLAPFRFCVRLEFASRRKSLRTADRRIHARR